MTTGQRDTLSALDMTLPPPRTWIDETLVFDRPEQLGKLLPAAIAGMHPDPKIVADIPEFGVFGGNPDVILAERILGNAPLCFPGDNVLNRYAHGSWALATLGRDDDAWQVVKKIPPVAERVRLPKGTLRMATFLALRREQASDALKCWNALAKWHRGSLTDEDMSLHDACKQLLLSMGG